MNTLLLWDEGGIAFGDLTFWNRPLLGTVTAIVVDCQFLFRDRQKVEAQADGRGARVWPQQRPTRQTKVAAIGLHDAADYLARPRHRSPLSPGPRQAQSEEARPPGQRPDARALGDHLWRKREPNGNRLRLN